uniref:NADH dehydrogenase subunit 5 n=1 Tax=Singapora shinshana TaxID=1539856 RepID=UPI002238827F|nr:NADH dehydrogenase subunit 5 [Singapora shinshana]UYF20495.1 NADH dehydrogenase subunit 5 [Singapora shinshana]
MLKFNFYFYWGIILIFMSFIFFYYSLVFISQDYSIFIEWKLYMLNSQCMFYVLIFDWISFLFVSVVLLISSMVVFYSINYMGLYSYSSNRFLFLVILFIISMMLMVMSPNLVSILLGWDGLGLVSYCLVIYFNSVNSYLAGMITCLTNRLGDIGLLISISWMMSFGSWHFMFYLDFYSSTLFYLLIISSFTKSAQIPFSSWLPAAMAAPTPVSSLVHSSTLVTAGVYLLIRFFNNFIYNNYYFLFLSIMTMFMSSFCANYEFDLKKVVALSTLSQLGLMMFSLFMGLVNLSFFHLLTHAMFKSLLFLCSGIFIYYMNDNQDIRMLGSVCNLMPFTTSCFNISNMALCGIPFLSGFYSKDLILEMSVMNNMNLFYYFLMYFCLGLTCCYSIRLFYYSMMVNYKFVPFLLILEEKMFMKFSIFFLTLLSIFFGCMIMWLILIDLFYILLPFYIKVLSLIFIFMGFWVGLQLFNMTTFIFNMSYYLFTNMWFMFSYSYYLYMIVYRYSYKYKIMLNWGEFYGIMGLSYYVLKMSNMIQFYCNNNMKIMLVSFLFWLMIFI